MSKLKIDAFIMMNAKQCLQDKDECIRHLADGLLQVSKDEVVSRGKDACNEIARDLAELTKLLSIEFDVSAEKIANKVKQLSLGEK